MTHLSISLHGELFCRMLGRDQLDELKGSIAREINQIDGLNDTPIRVEAVIDGDGNEGQIDVLVVNLPTKTDPELLFILPSTDDPVITVHKKVSDEIGCFCSRNDCGNPPIVFF